MTYAKKWRKESNALKKGLGITRELLDTVSIYFNTVPYFTSFNHAQPNSRSKAVSWKVFEKLTFKNGL